MDSNSQPMRSAFLRRFQSQARLRRSITVPGFTFLFVAALATAPLAYLAAFVADRSARGRLALTPTLAWIHTYIVAEMAGIVMAACLACTRPFVSRERYVASHDWLQHWWAATQFHAARRFFGFTLHVEGIEVLRQGPFILLCRHLSILDNLLPVVLAGSQGVHLRWVLSRRLLVQPSVDIVGHRLPTAFVGGAVRDPRGDLRRMSALAKGLGPREGMVLFPEGRLFSPAKRQAEIARLRRKGAPYLADAAEQLTNVLPPQLGGLLTVLRAVPHVDIVFCSHRGLEAAASRPAIARGGLLRKRVEVRCWRVAAADIPRGRAELRQWLLARWAEVDRFAAGA
jgi:1-acyl-sn-glycerol-3-phosphate acyltransferase